MSARAGCVVAVSAAPDNGFSKPNRDCIRLIEGLGVEGDAHLGRTVQHLYLAKKDPLAPNLRQVHLIHEELLSELSEKGFVVAAGELGENITTRDIDLLSLPTGAQLIIADTCIEITGLRNPCIQLDTFQAGLTKAVIEKDTHGKPVFKAGIMGIVIRGGEIRPDDAIMLELPPGPPKPLTLV